MQLISSSPSFSQRLPIHSNFLEHVYTGSCIMRCWSFMPSWIFWLKTWCQCSRFRQIGVLYLWDTWITPHKQYGSLIFYLFIYYLMLQCLSTDVHWLESFPFMSPWLCGLENQCCVVNAWNFGVWVNYSLKALNFSVSLQAWIHKSDQ